LEDKNKVSIFAPAFEEFLTFNSRFSIIKQVFFDKIIHKTRCSTREKVNCDNRVSYCEIGDYD